ncbi:DNA-directed RNA polymerase subunit alpha [Candidatus Falkowbacteria bacterium]|nr:MAG: DNA-directed RNA polymerase subunit alpha [Candidatus Falkowbacteria bacterium]
MNNIALPKKLSFLPTEDKNRSKAILEPLAPGYGTTIGNALRRVLLASLPGVAVIGAKIEGATHEFMALPNIKEDILEIILNLKKIRLHLDEGLDEARLELKAFGEKVITAADITKQAGVEITNPESVIAHLTDMGGKLNMEIFVRRGLGYETIESREEKKNELGYIDVDSIYSPVFTVGLDIENVRVGKMVNWEKLILDIETDGTITAEEAFKASANILIEQLNAVVALGEQPAEMSENEEVATSEEATEEAEVETPATEEVVEEEAPKKKAKKEKK